MTDRFKVQRSFAVFVVCGLLQVVGCMLGVVRPSAEDHFAMFLALSLSFEP